MNPWERLLTKQRFGKPSGTTESGRSHFHKDYDRVVFSHAFRRLAKKTQVHPLSTNDHVHTRLTHSLEVASLGRSFGMGVGEALADRNQLPQDTKPDDLGVIVQAACLAHDIGNPPFGHTGEDAIRDWFSKPANAYFLEPLTDDNQRLDFLYFEGNAQGFRLVSQLEKHRFNGGLRLTYPTLGALLKYPWLSTEAGPKRKFSCFASEQTALAQVAKQLGLTQISEHRWSRHPLSYLMEAADDICYRILDLEDAVELNIIRWETFQTLCKPLLQDYDDYAYLFEHQDKQTPALPIKSQMALIRGKAMEVLVSCVVDAFITTLPEVQRGKFSGSILSLLNNKPATDFFRQSAQIAEEQIFRNPAKTEVEVGAYATLEALLNALMGAVFELNQKGIRQLSRRNRSLLDLMGNHQIHESLDLYQSYLRTLDFISGMTDQYATYLANRINGIMI